MEVNILLIIVGGIIAIGAIVGFAKGAVRIAVSLGATILTLAVVYFATPYVSKAIYSLTPIDEMVEQQCIKTMTKAFTGDADTGSGFTEEQVKGILSAAGVSEQTLEAAGITIEDIVNGNVSDDLLQQYGISPDIFQWTCINGRNRAVYSGIRSSEANADCRDRRGRSSGRI